MPGRISRRWIMDVVFAMILVIWFATLYYGLPHGIRPEVSTLFSASYVFLGIGVLAFYLLSGMNYRLASLVHVGSLPFLGILYLFVRWMPDAIQEVGGIEEEFCLGILAYVLVLIFFLIVQLSVHLSEPESERARQFRGPTF